MFTRGRKRKGSSEMEIQRMRGVCARRTRTARVGRGSSPRERERRRTITVGGIRLAREKEGSGRWDGDGDIVEAHIHMRAPSNTRASGCTLGRQARALQTARLPPRTFGKINRIQEKPMVRQASGALSSPLHPRRFPPALSRLRSRSFPFPLSFSPSLSSSVLPPFRPLHPSCFSRRISRARTRGICVRRCSAIKRGRARVYTLAIDGDRRHACTHDGQGRR